MKIQEKVYCNICKEKKVKSDKIEQKQSKADCKNTRMSQAKIKNIFLNMQKFKKNIRIEMLLSICDKIHEQKFNEVVF